MRRGVRTVLVTKLAVVTFFGHLLQLGRLQLCHIAIVAVDAIEERVERRAQVEATPAPVAVLIDA